MRILKLLLMVLACLVGGQVTAETPWPGKDISGAMTLAGGGHFKGGHSRGSHFKSNHFRGSHFKGSHHRHFHGAFVSRHHGFMGHSHRFIGLHGNHGFFVVTDPRFDGHHHVHRVHRFHDPHRDIVIRFHESRPMTFTGSDFNSR